MGEENIRVLIVDDEFIMRQGLRYMIQWEKEGFTIVGEAANGKDAMDQIEKLKPQIVISDVVMPLMDGVDFTVAVHHRYPHIQMIILSGYDNFEYVKQTLMQGVVDYILKPTLTPHELLGVLQKAAVRIPGWHKDQAPAGNTAEELFKEVLLGETTAGEELQKIFAASYYCMYAVTIAHGDRQAAETAELLREKIQRAKSEFSGVQSCVVSMKKEQICVLFGYEMSQRSMLRIKLEKLNGQIGLMCEPAIGILSTSCQDIGQLREIYQRELARGADLSFYFPGKKLFVMENEKDRIGGAIERFDFTRYNRLLLGGQYRQAADQLLAYNHALCESRADVYRMKNQIKNMFMVFLDMLQLEDAEKLRVQEYFLREVDVAGERLSYEQTVAQIASKVADISVKQSTKADARMDQILSYIEQHYTEDMKLEDLGEQFGFSYNYLSAYFNQQMNEGFNDYLNRVRIHKACEILQDLTVPVAQVSALVGYSGHSYFCRVFKKLTGKTPSEWRRDSIEK